MAIRLVRETSETPNITNKDDTVMTRYAYGGFNGVVKGFGNECNYETNAGVFKILDGRIVIDGWEIDVDGAGWNLDLSNTAYKQLHSVYAEINVATETVKINSVYASGVIYPVIQAGDDLTQIPNGTARLLLYHIQIENGEFVEIVKMFDIIPYLGKLVFNNKNNLEKLEGDLTAGRVIVNNSRIAAYASNDYSKGTIETRLTKLGFKSGVISFAGSNYGSETEVDTSQNGVFRQGNYVFCNINISKYISTSVAQTYFLPGSIMFVLPENFRPQKDVAISVFSQSGGVVSGLASGIRCFVVRIGQNGNGVVEFVGTDLANSMLDKNVAFCINFGFEASPIK